MGGTFSAWEQSEIGWNLRVGRVGGTLSGCDLARTYEWEEHWTLSGRNM